MNDVSIVSDDHSSALSRFLTIRVKDRLLGLSISDIDDIIRDYAITPIPLSPSFIIGALNLRGRVCTVVDLASCLQLSGKPTPLPEVTQELPEEEMKDQNPSEKEEEGIESKKRGGASEKNAEVPALKKENKPSKGLKKGNIGPFYVIVHHGKDLYAITVDHVEDEIHIPASRIMRPPDNLPEHHQECAIGVLQQEGELLLLLDTSTILKKLQ